MKATWIVRGVKDKLGTTEPESIYFGSDGQAMERAAAAACDSGKYAEGKIERFLITHGTPCRCVPDKGTTQKVQEPQKPKEHSTMKKTLKTAIAGLVLAFGISTVFAQTAGTLTPTYGTQTINFKSYGMTNLAAATSTNLTANNMIIDCWFMKDLAALMSFNLVTTGSDANVTLVLDKSIDRTTWSTLGALTWSAVSSGTSTVAVATNWTVGGVGYLRVHYLTNGVSDAVLTNMVLQVALKRSAP